MKNEIVVYHATNFRSFEKIMHDEYIKPNKITGLISFGIDAFSLMEFCESKTTEIEEKLPKVILKFNLPKFTLLPDDGFKTLDESLQETGYCNFSGELETHNILGITLLGPACTIECNIRDWQQKYEENKNEFFKNF